MNQSPTPIPSGSPPPPVSEPDRQAHKQSTARKAIGGILLILGAAGTTLGAVSVLMGFVQLGQLGSSDAQGTIMAQITELKRAEVLQSLLGSLVILVPSLVFVFLGRHLYYKKKT